MRKKGQEEMVGFALIMIIVAVILLIFLGFALSKKDKIVSQDYQVNSFLSASLQYTTDCENNLGNFNIKDLIFACNKKERCTDGRDACDVLKSDFSGIIKEAWAVGKDNPNKGYILNITKNSENLLSLEEGIKTKNFKTGYADFAKNSNDFLISMRVYY